MKQISSIDLYFLVKEFKIFENQRIDSFYYENETFFLKIYVKRIGNLYLTNKISKFIYIDDKKHETSHPQNFIQFLRKYLKNTFIETIEQIEGERILKFKITKKDENDNISYYYLIIELFSNGNVVLTDENFNIKNSLIKKIYKDRTVKVHEVYELPPQKEISIFNLDENIFEKSFKETDLEIVKFLATRLGMGGKFSEEICMQAKVDKNAKQLTKDEIKQIIKKLEQLHSTDIKPYGIYKDDKLIDFMPFDFISITDEKKEFANYNQLIKTYFEQFNTKQDIQEKELKKELEKLKRRLQTQEQSLLEVHKEYDKYNEIGTKIFENYQLVEELLESINKAAKEKGWDHVKKTIKENQKLSKLVKTLNYKNNEIILNLE